MPYQTGRELAEARVRDLGIGLDRPFSQCIANFVFVHGLCLWSGSVNPRSSCCWSQRRRQASSLPLEMVQYASPRNHRGRKRSLRGIQTSLPIHGPARAKLGPMVAKRSLASCTTLTGNPPASRDGGEESRHPDLTHPVG